MITWQREHLRMYPNGRSLQENAAHYLGYLKIKYLFTKLMLFLREKKKDILKFKCQPPNNSNLLLNTCCFLNISLRETSIQVLKLLNIDKDETLEICP